MGNIESAGAWRASGASEYNRAPRRTTGASASDAVADNAAAFNPAAREKALAHELESRLSGRIERIRKEMSNNKAAGGAYGDGIGQILDIAA